MDRREYSLRLLTLPARPDRPMSIPLPKNKMTRLGRNNVAATDPQIVTFMMNTEEYSHNRDLLSRTHCELWFSLDGKLMIRDGGASAETGVTKPSVNGTSIQGILLPFGAERELRVGYEVELGSPQIVPGRRDDTPRPNEFVYRVEAEEPDCFRRDPSVSKRKFKEEVEVKEEPKVKDEGSTSAQHETSVKRRRQAVASMEAEAASSSTAPVTPLTAPAADASEPKRLRSGKTYL